MRTVLPGFQGVPRCLVGAPAAIGELHRVGFAQVDHAGAQQLAQDVLELTPGSVTPFGLINDTQRRVTVILDDEIAR